MFLFIALCVVESVITKVTGVVGGQVTIQCSYADKWYERSNDKYFCRKKCDSYNDILVQTQKNKNYIERGRYGIHDNRNGDFTVTIKNLVKSDSGTYWCGLDRSIKDSYQEVPTTTFLSLSSSPSSSSLPSSPSSSSSSSPSSSTLNGSVMSLSDVIEYGLFVVLSVILFSPPLQGCHGDGDYEEIKECPLRSGSATTTIYATANLPTSLSDSPHYATVNFHKNPSSPNKATAAIAKEGTSSYDYATVNFGQSPVYSSVNHPHSSSESPPIYSTVSKPRDT
uniref:Immunoglobulin domain-containing protein n=1 Tax=Hucho hucho TaxID=62062 RepID=A0A4W5MIE6_9TELE